MEFFTPEELEKQIQNDLFDVGGLIADKILEEVQKSIQEIVYDPYRPVKYERQHEKGGGGFYESWSFSMDIGDNGEILAEVKSFPEFMDLDPFIYVHGSYPPEDTDFVISYLNSDRRDNMDSMIAEGWGYDFFVPPTANNPNPSNWWTKPRNYMTPVLDKLNESVQFYSIVNRAFKKQNIELTWWL